MSKELGPLETLRSLLAEANLEPTPLTEWTIVAEEVVKPALDAAAAVLEEQGVGAVAVKTGNGVELQIRWTRSGTPTHVTLEIAPSGKDKEIGAVWSFLDVAASEELRRWDSAAAIDRNQVQAVVVTLVRQLLSGME